MNILAKNVGKSFFWCLKVRIFHCKLLISSSQECAENLSFRVDKAWRQRCSQRFRNVLETGSVMGAGLGGATRGMNWRLVALCLLACSHWRGGVFVGVFLFCCPDIPL